MWAWWSLSGFSYFEPQAQKNKRYWGGAKLPLKQQQGVYVFQVFFMPLRHTAD
jgi:hypothetical protein